MRLKYWWQGVLLIGVIGFVLVILGIPLLVDRNSSKFFESMACIFGFSIGCMFVGFGHWIAMNNKDLKPNCETSTTSPYLHTKVTKALIIIGILAILILSISSAIVLGK